MTSLVLQLHVRRSRRTGLVLVGLDATAAIVLMVVSHSPPRTRPGRARGCEG